MKTIFIKPYQIKKHKIIKHFPNKQIKTCIDKNGKEYTLHIIYPCDTIKIKSLNSSEVQWFTGKPDLKVTMVTLNWIPKELIAGIIDGKYSQNTELSLKTGYISSCNTGSNSVCVLTEKLQYCLSILIKAGFKME